MNKEKQKEPKYKKGDVVRFQHRVRNKKKILTGIIGDVILRPLNLSKYIIYVKGLNPVVKYTDVVDNYNPTTLKNETKKRFKNYLNHLIRLYIDSRNGSYSSDKKFQDFKNELVDEIEAYINQEKEKWCLGDLDKDIDTLLISRRRIDRWLKESEERGKLAIIRKNQKISNKIIDSITDLCRLWTPEPIGFHSPVNTFINSLQDIIIDLNSNED